MMMKDNATISRRDSALLDLIVMPITIPIPSWLFNKLVDILSPIGDT